MQHETPPAPTRRKRGKPDGEAGLSKVDGLVRAIRARIADGGLRPGERLRSIREEAAAQGLARNTVIDAYLRLAGQGLLIARPGSGYYVAEAPSPARRVSPAPFAGIPDGAALLTEQLEKRLAIRPGDGRLPADWLEDSQLRSALGRVRISSSDGYNYNTTRGFLPLRQRLAAALAERAIDCVPDQVLMTHGANHALDLIVRSYIAPGEPVLVDDPGYYPLFSKLNLARARIIGVPRRADGPDPEAFVRLQQASGARFFFTQSQLHNPTGSSIAPAVAFAILHHALAAGVTIVEDDPFADLAAPEAPRFAALDGLRQVIYVGSFSKTLAGSFRTGFIATSPERIEELTELLIVTAVSTSTHNERILNALIEQGQYLRHLRRLRERVQTAGSTLRRRLRDCGLVLPYAGPGSIYLWAELPEGLDEAALARSAAAEGIFVAPSALFRIEPGSRPAMRVNVAQGSAPKFLDWLGRATRAQRA